jgi:O-antigen/teichoic acid export membrane protein
MTDNVFFRKMINYIPGRLLIGILNFLPIILLTKLMDPREYGQYKFVFIGATFLIIFTIGWLNQAIVRFWHSFPDKKILFSTSIFSIITISIITLLLLYIVNIFIDFANNQLLTIAFLLLVGKPIFDLNTSIYRNMELLKEFNKNEIIRIISLIIGILLLVPLLNSYGAILAVGLSYLIVNIISILRLKSHISLNKKDIKLNSLKELFLYGYPLIFTMFSGVIIASSDQFMIGIFQDEKQVGIYAANYDILEKVLLYINSIFVLATTPKLIKIFDEKGIDEARKFNTIIYDVFLSLFLPMGFLIVLNDKLFITIFTDESYYSGRLLVVLIVLSMFVNALNMYIVKGLTVIKKTKAIAFIYLFGAILNIILNLVLIPLFSIYGAIIATLVSYIVLTVLSIIYTKDNNVLLIKYARILIQLFAYLISFIILEILFDDIVKFWVGSTVFFAIFIVLNLPLVKKVNVYIKK